MFVFPFEKSNPVFRTPLTVYIIIGLNTIIYIVANFNIHFEQIVAEYGFIPANHRLITLFSSMFLHGDFFHILGNMYFLWMLGDNVEDVLGPLKFSLVYIVCGLGASFAHYLSNPDSPIPAIGASGAISGIMGLYIVFFPKAKFYLGLVLIRFYVGRIKTTAFAALLTWFGEQFLLGLYILAVSKAEYIGVAFWAHIGGFVFGLVFGKILIYMGYLQKYLNQYEKLKEKKLEEEEERETRKAKEKEERGSFWGTIYLKGENTDEVIKESPLLIKYCYKCRYYESETGVCRKLHEQIFDYPEKFKKCDGDYFEPAEEK